MVNALFPDLYLIVPTWFDQVVQATSNYFLHAIYFCFNCQWVWSGVKPTIYPFVVVLQHQAGGLTLPPLKPSAYPTHISLELDTLLVLVLYPFQNQTKSHILLFHPPKNLHKSDHKTRAFHFHSSCPLPRQLHTNFHFGTEWFLAHDSYPSSTCPRRCLKSRSISLPIQSFSPQSRPLHKLLSSCRSIPMPMLFPNFYPPQYFVYCFGSGSSCLRVSYPSGCTFFHSPLQDQSFFFSKSEYPSHASCCPATLHCIHCIHFPRLRKLFPIVHISVINNNWNKFWMNFDEIFGNGVSWDKEQMFTFQWWSATEGRCLPEVCALQVFFVSCNKSVHVTFDLSRKVSLGPLHHSHNYQKSQRKESIKGNIMLEMGLCTGPGKFVWVLILVYLLGHENNNDNNNKYNKNNKTKKENIDPQEL